MSVDYRRPSVTERARVSFAAAVAVAAADTPWGKLRAATQAGAAAWCLSDPMEHRRACAMAEDVEDLEKADAAFRAAAADAEYHLYIRQLRDAGLRYDPAKGLPGQPCTGKDPRSRRKKRKDLAKFKQLERYARERREVRRALANRPEHLVQATRGDGTGGSGSGGGSEDGSQDGGAPNNGPARGSLAALRAALAAPDGRPGAHSGGSRAAGSGRPSGHGNEAVNLFLRQPQLTFKQRCALRGLPTVCNVVDVVTRMTHGGGLPGCKAVPRSLGGAPKWKFSQSCFASYRCDTKRTLERSLDADFGHSKIAQVHKSLADPKELSAVKKELTRPSSRRKALLAQIERISPLWPGCSFLRDAVQISLFRQGIFVF